MSFTRPKRGIFTGYPFSGTDFTGYPFTGIQFGEDIITGIFSMILLGRPSDYAYYTREGEAFSENSAGDIITEMSHHMNMLRV